MRNAGIPPLIGRSREDPAENGHPDVETRKWPPGRGVQAVSVGLNTKTPGKHFAKNCTDVKLCV